MIFFRPQWPGGPQEVNGVKLRPKRDGSVFTLEAPAKHKQALVALGWNVQPKANSGRVTLSGPPPTPAPPAAVESAPASSPAAEALASNAKTVVKEVRAGTHDAILAEMLSAEEDAGVGTGSSRGTVTTAIEKRIEEIS